MIIERSFASSVVTRCRFKRDRWEPLGVRNSVSLEIRKELDGRPLLSFTPNSRSFHRGAWAFHFPQPSFLHPLVPLVSSPRIGGRCGAKTGKLVVLSLPPSLK